LLLTDLLDLRLSCCTDLLELSFEAGDLVIPVLLDGGDRHVGVHVRRQRRLDPPLGLPLRLLLVGVALA